MHRATDVQWLLSKIPGKENMNAALYITYVIFAKGVRMIPSQVSLQLPSIPSDAFMFWISVHMLELEGSGQSSRSSKLRLQELREFEILSTTANPVTAMSFIKAQMSAPVQSLTKCFNKTDTKNSGILCFHEFWENFFICKKINDGGQKTYGLNARHERIQSSVYERDQASRSNI